MSFSRLVGPLCLGAALLANAPGFAADPALLSIEGGIFDLVNHHKHEFEARLEYRFSASALSTDGAFRGFHPLVGVMGNTAKAYFGYAGLAAPFVFDDGRWEVVPAAALGAYHKGDGIDLGGTFEFHLGLGASYAVTRGLRLGVALDHISNANTHKKNPGDNSALVTLSFALDGP